MLNVPDICNDPRETVRQAGCFFDGWQREEALDGPSEQPQALYLLFQFVPLQLSLQDSVLQLFILGLQALQPGIFFQKTTCRIVTFVVI